MQPGCEFVCLHWLTQSLLTTVSYRQLRYPEASLPAEGSSEVKLTLKKKKNKAATTNGKHEVL